MCLAPELSPRLWSLWPQIHAVALDFGVDYWEDLLIPLDNYISKGTPTFIGSTNPNYQESLYQMVEHTLTGETRCRVLVVLVVVGGEVW